MQAVGSEAVAATLAAAVYESRGAAEVMVHDLLREWGDSRARGVHQSLAGLLQPLLRLLLHRGRSQLRL